jgi:beta-lactamase class D
MRTLFLVFSLTVLFSCSVNNTREDNSLEKYFSQHKLTGTFAMFDNGSGQFTVYNMNRYRDSAYLPASTFKIVESQP